MKQTTVIDPSIAGISGDMLLAALIDVGADVHAIQNIMRLIPRYYPRCKSIILETKTVMNHGFRTSGIELKTSEEHEEVSTKRFRETTEELIRNSKLSVKATEFAKNSVNMLIDVESRLHGTDIHETHLHEAGSADTLADIFGVSAAADSLSLFDGNIVSTPLAVGGGHVTFSHGTLSVPAPAVMEMVRLRHIPITGGPEEVELATPTGVAMLANLAQDFVPFYPTMIAEKVGYGSGTNKLISSPNILRVIIGTQTEVYPATEFIQLLETNLDDITGETLSHALQRLIESGARDTWITSAQFKKNRPGHILQVLCDPCDTERLSRIMMEETGTLGVRRQIMQRRILNRTLESMSVEVAGKRYNVRVKIARDAEGNIVTVKPEFEDVRLIAKDTEMPARRVEQIVSAQTTRFYDNNSSASSGKLD